MPEPLRVAPPRRPAATPPSQDEVLDRLAGKIADAEDDRARQRLDELYRPQKYWTPEQKRGNAVAIWVVLALMAMALVVAFNCHR